jgi:hypothetical protein
MNAELSATTLEVLLFLPYLETPLCIHVLNQQIQRGFRCFGDLFPKDSMSNCGNMANVWEQTYVEGRALETLKQARHYDLKKLQKSLWLHSQHL